MNRLVHLPTGRTMLVPEDTYAISFPLFDTVGLSRYFNPQYDDIPSIPSTCSGTIETAIIHDTEFHYVGEYWSVVQACFGEAFNLISRKFGMPKAVVYHFSNQQITVKYQADQNVVVVLPKQVQDVVLIHNYKKLTTNLTVILRDQLLIKKEQPIYKVVSGWLDLRHTKDCWDWVRTTSKSFERMWSKNRDLQVFSTFRFSIN